MSIVWLGQPACHDVASVGGKAANLSRLAAQFRVPQGFCLTAEALGSHAPVDAPLSQLLLDQVAAAYKMLADKSGQPDPSVAVRSSACDEDGAASSFAGQHETYLNITGADAIADAVVRCHQSAFAPRVLEYRRRQGLPVDGVRLAVLVQRLVPADVSAVAFSRNPVTGDPDEIVINAAWGLGESIVGGTVTPDTYVVAKKGLTVAERVLGQKEQMTVSAPNGTKEVPVPRLLQAQFSLNDAKALEIARLVQALEETMGWPVDIECAFHGDELNLLQCRPITVLK